MFEAQVAYFSALGFRCITFDHRGQGRSGVTADGYDMDTLSEDAAALIEHLGVAPVHFAGLSMGGFVGMRLAARRPELLKTLMLLETSADGEPEENGPKYRKLEDPDQWIRQRRASAATRYPGAPTAKETFRRSSWASEGCASQTFPPSKGILCKPRPLFCPGPGLRRLRPDSGRRLPTFSKSRKLDRSRNKQPQRSSW